MSPAQDSSHVSRQSANVRVGDPEDLSIGACASMTGLVSPVGEAVEVDLAPIEPPLSDDEARAKAESTGHHVVSVQAGAILQVSLEGQQRGASAVLGSAVGAAGYQVTVPVRPAAGEAVLLACRPVDDTGVVVSGI